ncbi:PQQ-dependent sugar dehydrogenase [Bizionia sediminis]|uniref:PQQ-dependent sugar dehydrogenase n=1 Tax=Bizionia sediminis TaxID=1737064 RepID=A0ABW5KV02_9FLAO
MKLVTIILILWSGCNLFAQQLTFNLHAAGFNNPVGLKHANDNRLFVVEKAGLIKIIDAQQNVLTTPFLNIDNLVSNSGGERGLLGLAFHPNYASNGYFYVNYINNSGNTVISRFSTSTTNANVATANSELILLTINQPYGNHNGGDMAFGPDGYLYIATGDGGSGGDPENRSQDLTTLLGKLLRIDVNQATNGNNYGIPQDNPFINTPNALNEIWAYGLRNPWRFSFDTVNNTIWIADVGQNNIEEINAVNTTTAGINYGWRCYEGNAPYNTSGCPDPNTLQFPVAQYTHTGSGNFKCSITGGYVYRGAAFPNFIGKYFFADYCSDEVGILSFENNAWNMSFTPPLNNKGFTSFGEDSAGELYIVASLTGEVFKITDANLSVEETNKINIQLYPNPAKTEVNVRATNSSITLQKVLVYSADGKYLETNWGKNSSLITINTANLAKGLYFLEIYDSNNRIFTKKIAKN